MKKKKVKDMSLGSETMQFQEESRQNLRVIDKLIDDARLMNKQLQSVGMPLDQIKRELFGDSPRKISPQKPAARSS